MHDLGHCLRAAAPPLFVLIVLALARTTQGAAPSPAGVGELLLVAWRAAVLGTLLWFLVAAVWTATRPLRDRRAFQRLQHLREIATPEDRALVHVQTVVWSSAAGRHVVRRQRRHWRDFSSLASGDDGSSWFLRRGRAQG